MLRLRSILACASFGLLEFALFFFNREAVACASLGCQSQGTRKDRIEKSQSDGRCWVWTQGPHACRPFRAFAAQRSNSPGICIPGYHISSLSGLKSLSLTKNQEPRTVLLAHSVGLAMRSTTKCRVSLESLKKADIFHSSLWQRLPVTLVRTRSLTYSDDFRRDCAKAALECQASPVDGTCWTLSSGR